MVIDFEKEIDKVKDIEKRTGEKIFIIDGNQDLPKQLDQREKVVTKK